MKLLMLALACLLLSAPLLAEEVQTGASSAKFFEPDEEESSQEWKAIQAQQAAYVSAREREDWTEARKFALYNFVIAWTYFNEAMEIATSREGWNSVGDLADALGLLTEADAALDKAEKAPSAKTYAGEIKDCREKVSRNRTTIEAQSAALAKKSKPKK